MEHYRFEVTLDESLYRHAVRLADRRRQAVASVIQDLVDQGLRSMPRTRKGLGKRIRRLAVPGTQGTPTRRA